MIAHIIVLLYTVIIAFKHITAFNEKIVKKLFALLAFFSLIFSPFRTRKIKADETELLFNSEASTSISEKPKEEGALELIEKLNRLKENGTITAEEFDSKKKELLSRI